MPDGIVVPHLDQFLAAADAVARERPEVDRELAREVLAEAATLIHNSLVLDGLDPHDERAAVAALCSDLVAGDPGAALRSRARTTLARPSGLHDPAAVSAALLGTVALLGL